MGRRGAAEIRRAGRESRRGLIARPDTASTGRNRFSPPSPQGTKNQHKGTKALRGRCPQSNSGQVRPCCWCLDWRCTRGAGTNPGGGVPAAGCGWPPRASVSAGLRHRDAAHRARRPKRSREVSGRQWGLSQRAPSGQRSATVAPPGPRCLSFRAPSSVVGTRIAPGGRGSRVLSQRMSPRAPPPSMSPRASGASREVP